MFQLMGRGGAAPLHATDLLRRSCWAKGGCCDVRLVSRW